MQHTVPNDVDYELQGDLTIDNVTVYGGIQVLGTVNGKIFNENTVLLKDKNQIITGPVSIQNEFRGEKIYPVTFDNLNLNEVNGREIKPVLNYKLLRGQKVIGKNLDFIAPLVVNRLHTNGHKLYGTDLEAQLRSLETQSDLTPYEDQFVALQHVSEMIRESNEMSSRYLSHIQVEKGITGKFDKVVPVTFSDEILRLAAFDSSDSTHSVQFYRYTDDSKHGYFVIDETFPPLRAGDMKITNVEGLTLFDNDVLVIEKHTGAAFVQTALGYFEGALQRMWVFNSTYPVEIKSLRLNENDCIIRYAEVLTRSEISCLGNHQFSLDQYLDGAPIAQAVTLATKLPVGDDLLVLTTDGNVIIYRTKPNRKLNLAQSLQPLNPIHVDGICKDLHCYTAICSEKTENAAHLGSIEIYRNSNGSLYELFQTIKINTPLNVKFTRLASNDILLYVLTESPGHSLIVYKYFGAAGFKEYISSSIIPKGKRMTVIKLPDQSELLAIVTETEVALVQPVMHQT